MAPSAGGQCCQIGRVLNLIVRVNIVLGGWTKFGLVWGQFGGFQTYTLYRLIGYTSPSVHILHPISHHDVTKQHAHTTFFLLIVGLSYSMHQWMTQFWLSCVCINECEIPYVDYSDHFGYIGNLNDALFFRGYFLIAVLTVSASLQILIIFGNSV